MTIYEVNDDGPEIELDPSDYQLPDFPVKEIKPVQENVANGRLTPVRDLAEANDPNSQPEVVTSNRDEPGRRPKEFAARHIQMMAIGTIS